FSSEAVREPGDSLYQVQVVMPASHHPSELETRLLRAGLNVHTRSKQHLSQYVTGTEEVVDDQFSQRVERIDGVHTTARLEDVQRYPEGGMIVGTANVIVREHPEVPIAHLR